jgi:hypothetical protein
MCSRPYSPTRTVDVENFETKPPAVCISVGPIHQQVHEPTCPESVGSSRRYLSTFLAYLQMLQLTFSHTGVSAICLLEI